MYPVDRKYSNEHEWAKQEPDGVVTVGITEYAQEHLGDIVFVAMSQVGSTVNQIPIYVESNWNANTANWSAV